MFAPTKQNLCQLLNAIEYNLGSGLNCLMLHSMLSVVVPKKITLQ